MDAQGISHSSSRSLEIGSMSSAFLPYRSLTVLTNLQRGNVKTTTPDHELIKASNGSAEISWLHEKSRNGILSDEDLKGKGIEELNKRNDSGKTALMIASCNGHLKTVQLLIDRGASVDYRGLKDETALMYAAARGRLDVISYLISRGADIEAVDDSGNTPLMFAVFTDHPEAVKILLANGASLLKRNDEDESPLEIAVNKCNKTVQHVIENYIESIMQTRLS